VRWRETSYGRGIVPAAIGFEAGLGLFAIIVGYLIGFSPLRTLHQDGWAHVGAQLALGTLAIIPMLTILAITEWAPLESIRRLRTFVLNQVVPLFAELSIIELALVSLAAGCGEELLFRGLIQDGLATWIGGGRGQAVSLVIASLCFGVVHWLTPTYAILAAGVGLYLGWLFIWQQSIIVPTIAHAGYDFVALVYLIRRRRT
jgi:membrane protease YdiL (CAAX protease family)